MSDSLRIINIVPVCPPGFQPSFPADAGGVRLRVPVPGVPGHVPPGGGREVSEKAVTGTGVVEQAWPWVRAYPLYNELKFKTLLISLCQNFLLEFLEFLQFEIANKILLAVPSGVIEMRSGTEGHS